MGLQDIRTRLQTDKQLQIIVGAVVVIIVVGVVAMTFMGGSSSAPTGGDMSGMPTGTSDTTASSTPPMGGADPAAAGAPGAMPPGAPGGPGMQSPGMPAPGGPPPPGWSPAGMPGAAKTEGASGPPSLRQGPPTMPYRPDPFDTNEAGGIRVAQALGLTELPRVTLPPLRPRRSKEGLKSISITPLPNIRRRVSGIMLSGHVSAILEEEGSEPKVIQPGEQYSRSDGTWVRVEKIEAEGVTLREGKVSIRVPMKGSDEAPPQYVGNTGSTQNNGTPSYGTPGGMPGGPAMPPPGAPALAE